jgi:type II secretory pathway predicted ATPase ExeA
MASCSTRTLEPLPPNGLRIGSASLVPPLNNARAPLRAILTALGEAPQWATPDAVSQLERLTMPWHEQGRVLLVIIDEAQDLATGVVLFLRSLLHTPIGDRLPVRIVLLGTPALASRLRVKAMEPISSALVPGYRCSGLRAKRPSPTSKTGPWPSA